jgi:hypothetical protein
MTFWELVFDPNLAATDHRNVVETAAVEDHALSRRGGFRHSCMRFADVLNRWAARASQQVSAWFFTLVIFTDFREFVVENDKCLVEFL